MFVVHSLAIWILEFKRQLEDHLRIHLKFKSLLEGPKDKDHYAKKTKDILQKKPKTDCSKIKGKDCKFSYGSSFTITVVCIQILLEGVTLFTKKWHQGLRESGVVHHR
ncbi:hypothetical protein ACSQ67_016074 [Phaseolus vulgaris]